MLRNRIYWQGILNAKWFSTSKGAWHSRICSLVAWLVMSLTIGCTNTVCILCCQVWSIKNTMSFLLICLVKSKYVAVPTFSFSCSRTWLIISWCSWLCGSLNMVHGLFTIICELIAFWSCLVMFCSMAFSWSWLADWKSTFWVCCGSVLTDVMVLHFSGGLSLTLLSGRFRAFFICIQ